MIPALTWLADNLAKQNYLNGTRQKKHGKACLAVLL